MNVTNTGENKFMLGLVIGNELNCKSIGLNVGKLILMCYVQLEAPSIFSYR